MKKAKFIMSNGNIYTPFLSSKNAMWARSIWFEKLLGKPCHVAGKEKWEQLKKENVIQTLTELLEGNWEIT